jgi:aryl-alcohol dehydrogenase-like predicted oxidoreductase
MCIIAHHYREATGEGEQCMEKRKLGKSGLEIAPLALGGNVFGWTADEQMSFKIMDAFAAAGFNFIDTADVYSIWVPGHQGGESESVIGKWLKQRGKRSDILIATKAGFPMGPDKKGLSKTYIIRAVEDSLKRLQTDYIDLYQSHTDDPDTPQEETMETYTGLIKEGKVRAIGASNFSAARLAGALQISEQHGFAAYQTLQPQYNLYDRAEFETDLAPLCRETGLGMISYYSLASGFLTGKYRSEKDLTKSPRGRTVQAYLNDRGYRILQALDQVSGQYGVTPARVSLAWLLSRPGLTAPIASATSLEQLSELTGAATLDLDRDSIALLNQASSRS